MESMTHRHPGFRRGTNVGSQLRLYRVSRHGRTIIRLTHRTVAIEKSLQTFMERHLLALFNVHFLATEYRTGQRHGGRIDTLGIDLEGTPVVFEYKRTASMNLISQGLFYLDWLDDHDGEFRSLVQDHLGGSAQVSRRAPRLICVAASFSRYDLRAVRQIGRRIDLVQYGWYDDIVMLSRVSGSEM
jgi:hypothetical protein